MSFVPRFEDVIKKHIYTNSHTSQQVRGNISVATRHSYTGSREKHTYIYIYLDGFCSCRIYISSYDLLKLICNLVKKVYKLLN